MKIIALIIFLPIFLALGAILAVKGYEHWQASTTDFLGRFGICIIAVGLFGVIEPVCVQLLPLDHIELPNTLGADRLTAPDGRVFIVSSPILRVQRYGPEGFEKAFLVGKVSSSAMSPFGFLLICAPGGQLRTYSPDGVEAPSRGSCQGGLPRTFYSYPSKAKVPAIAFNWTALAVPLWHPFAALCVITFGFLLFKISSSDEWWDAPESNPGGRGSY
ncbi:MAG: hypothetical protein WBX25_35500 [Rhodomicrobium sp.]